MVKHERNRQFLGLFNEGSSIYRPDHKFITPTKKLYRKLSKNLNWVATGRQYVAELSALIVYHLIDKLFWFAL